LKHKSSFVSQPAQLTQLSQLKEAGALTEEEFRLAKAKLLTY